MLSAPSVDPSVFSVDVFDDSKSGKVDEEELTCLFDNDMILLLSPHHKDDEKRTLTPLGRQQAKRTGERLAKIIQHNNKQNDAQSRIKVFASSDLTRAKETADIIHKELEEMYNQHNADQLVRQKYTANAIYYNHRPVLIGTKAISKEYSYMNNPKYSLNLTPIVLELVNERIAFEIGQCSGSYNGKYVLVWEKTKDGWKVLFDANY